MRKSAMNFFSILILINLKLLEWILPARYPSTTLFCQKRVLFEVNLLYAQSIVSAPL